MRKEGREDYRRILSLKMTGCNNIKTLAFIR